MVRHQLLCKHVGPQRHLAVLRHCLNLGFVDLKPCKELLGLIAVEVVIVQSDLFFNLKSHVVSVHLTDISFLALEDEFPIPQSFFASLVVPLEVEELLIHVVAVEAEVNLLWPVTANVDVVHLCIVRDSLNRTALEDQFLYQLDTSLLEFETNGATGKTAVVIIQIEGVIVSHFKSASST